MKDSIRFFGNFVFVLLIFTTLFSYAMFQGGFVSWFLFYSFLPILIYHLGLLIYPMKNWELTRKLSKHLAHAGDEVTVTLTMKRSFPFPLYYCVFEEVLPASLGRKDNKHHKYHFMDQPEMLRADRTVKKILFIGLKKQIDISYTMDQLPRGEHRLEAIRVLTSDVFGFIKKEHVFAMEDELIVRPNERELHLSEGASSFEQGSTPVTSFHLENTNIATGVREYAPGDRFSWIHWKQTAKNNTVMTKEFEQERSTNLLLILDASLSKRSNPLAFEAAVELTLSLISRLERSTVDVGLLALGKETVSFPINHDSMMKERMKNYLTKTQPDGEQAFPILLKEKMQLIDRADRIVILTQFMDDFFKQAIQELKFRTRISVFYIQSSRFVSAKEKEIISQMKNEGIVVQKLTEKELSETPLEVKIR